MTLPRIAFVLCVLTALVLATEPAAAHELGLAKASLDQIDEHRYRLRTSVPDSAAYLYRMPVSPEGCQLTEERKETAGLQRHLSFLIDCKERGLLPDDRLLLPWDRSGVLVSAQLLDGSSAQGFFARRDGALVVELGFLGVGEAGQLDEAERYLRFGVEHILDGADHLAFVFCLCLLASGWRLVKLVTAFTLGHSIALTLAAIGWIQVAMVPVEACIALSIVVLASEVLSGRERQQGYWLTAAFGMLHGLGFASAIQEFGLSKNALVLSLFSFNIGVELGQVLFVVAVMAVMKLLNSVHLWGPRFRHAAAFMVGAFAMSWTLERVF